MAQLLNRLRAEERIAGVEFCTPRALRVAHEARYFSSSVAKKAFNPPPRLLSRASTGRHGRKRPGSLPHSLADRSVPLTRRRVHQDLEAQVVYPEARKNLLVQNRGGRTSKF